MRELRVHHAQLQSQARGPSEDNLITLFTARDSVAFAATANYIPWAKVAGCRTHPIAVAGVNGDATAQVHEMDDPHSRGKQNTGTGLVEVSWA